MAVNIPPSVRDIRECFHVFDANSNGFIDVNEFLNFMRLLGSDIVADRFFKV